jgi:hypothetical protein
VYTTPGGWESELISAIANLSLDWERTISMIFYFLARPLGRDVCRFKINLVSLCMCDGWSVGMVIRSFHEFCCMFEGRASILLSALHPFEEGVC